MSIKIEKTENNNELKLEFTIDAKIFADGIEKVLFITPAQEGTLLKPLILFLLINMKRE